MYFRKSHRNTDLTNYIMIQYIPCKVTSGHICPKKATIGLNCGYHKCKCNITFSKYNINFGKGNITFLKSKQLFEIYIRN